MTRLLPLLLLSIALVAAGCGDDDDGGNATADMGAAAADTTGSADTAAPSTDDGTPAADDGAAADNATPTPDTTPAGPQPRGAANPPMMGAQIDRTGRPAINTALNATFSADAGEKDAAKDAYNQAGQAAWADFGAAFAGSLAILDSLDTVCGNQLLADDDNADGRYAGLVGVLTDDRLYVHSGRGTCGTYLGLEAEVVGAVAEGDGGCGGRTPADDVIERSYSVLAAGALAGIDDGVAADDGAQTEAFPFLGPPAAQ